MRRTRTGFGSAARTHRLRECGTQPPVDHTIGRPTSGDAVIHFVPEETRSPDRWSSVLRRRTDRAGGASAAEFLAADAAQPAPL
ncbi:hypothetical protein GCM10010372_40660 [Streptomyces tauricus]|nr:hypothetical protein GCM10010372_40660 [Streptomyces tauricus]